MPGRPPWSQPGTEGGGQTVAVQNRPNVVTKKVDKTGTVSSGGGTELVEIFAPTGSVYELTALWVQADEVSNATSGKHGLTVSMPQSVQVLRGKSTYSDVVRFNKFYWEKASDLIEPDTGAGQARAAQSVIATEDKPMQILYSNDTDADSNGTRTHRMAFREVTY